MPENKTIKGLRTIRSGPHSFIFLSPRPLGGLRAIATTTSCLWEETGVEDGFDRVCNEKLRMPTLTKLLLSYQIHVMTQVTSRQPSNWGTFGNQAKLLGSSDSVLRKFSKFCKYLLEMLHFKAQYEGVEPAP